MISLRKKTDRRGGVRPGAGRKPSDPSGAKKPWTVWLSPAEQALCLRHGGTVQEGLRRLVAMAGK